MCFDFGLVLSVGFVLQENRKIYKKQIPSLRSTRRNGKTAPIEIQQQMQDNIQWIKAQENKLVVGSCGKNPLC
jgi:urocanate hydratase